MLKTMAIRSSIAAILAGLAIPAHAIADPQRIDIPAGSLLSALEMLATQANVDLVYQDAQVQGLRTAGVTGEISPHDAVVKLLQGTPLKVRQDEESGAILIMVPAAGAEASATQTGASYSSPTRLRLAQSNQLDAQAGDGQYQNDLTTLQEIVVTAQKRDEKLQDVPMSVAVVDARYMVAHNELRVEDYIHRLPGVSLALVGNAGEPQIVLRGMTTGPGGNPTAGVVIDEVPYTRSRGLFLNSIPDIDPGDLRQVEVLRGPQGTLYGASNIGGLLKYVTQDPSMEGFSGQVSVGSSYVHHGDDLGYSARGSVNIPLGNTLAMRVSGFSVDDPGYIDNPQTGDEDVNDRDARGGRLSMLWQPAESTSVKFGAIVQERNRNGMAEVDRALGSDPQRSFRGGTGIYDRETQLYSLTVKSSLGPVEFVSATGYGTEEATSVLDVTALYPPGFASGLFPGADDIVIAATIEDEKFTQEFRAEIPLGERVRWLAGVFYTKESNVYDLTIDALTPTGEGGALILRNAARPGTDYEERAVFTNLTVDITDRFDVQFGGRYSENDQVEMLSRVPFGLHPAGAPFMEHQRQVADGNAFTYQVTPRFKIAPDLMTYARYATGYRPGGSNLNCGFPGVPCEFDEDTSTNYEIGIKGSPFAAAFSFDLAIYRIEWDDIQTAGLKPPGGDEVPVAVTYTGNLGEATSEGVELSISTRLFSGLSLSLAGAYNDTELLTALPGDIGPGSQLPYSPRWSGSLSAEQQFLLDVWSGANLVVGATASYMGERSSTFRAPGDPAQMPSYSRFDLNFALNVQDWSINLFVNNVADKRGVLAYSEILPGSATYIEPRTVGLSLSKQI